MHTHVHIHAGTCLHIHAHKHIETHADTAPQAAALGTLRHEGSPCGRVASVALRSLPNEPLFVSDSELLLRSLGRPLAAEV